MVKHCLAFFVCLFFLGCGGGGGAANPSPTPGSKVAVVPSSQSSASVTSASKSSSSSVISSAAAITERVFHIAEDTSMVIDIDSDFRIEQANWEPHKNQYSDGGAQLIPLHHDKKISYRSKPDFFWRRYFLLF